MSHADWVYYGSSPPISSRSYHIIPEVQVCQNRHVYINKDKWMRPDINIYICIHVWICIHICICIYTYTSIHVYIYIHVYRYIQVYMYIDIPKHRKRKWRRLRASATFDHPGRSDVKVSPTFVKCLCLPPCKCSYVPSACSCACVCVCVCARAHVCTSLSLFLSLSLALALTFSMLVDVLSARVVRILFVVCIHVDHVQGAQVVACAVL